MCEVKEIRRREETERYYRLLQGNENPLPLFLYDDPRYLPVAVCCQKAGSFKGLAYGVMQRGDRNFYLHYLRLAGSGQIKKDISRFSEQLFELVHEKYGADKVVINIEQADDLPPEYIKFLEKIKNCSLEEITFYRQVGIATRDFEHFRQFHWYCPGLMEKKGYEAVPADRCQGAWMEELRKKEQEGEVPEDYLSPGMWEEHWEYDPDTSFVLVKKGENVPIGWIVTERVSESMVKLRRFFIYDEARRLCLGPSFSTWVLERIQEKYERLWFEVEKGNRQMEMFTRCYCRPILAFDFFKCKLIIKIKGGQKNGMDTGEIE